MKTISAIMLVFLSCVVLFAQDKKETTETKSSFDLNFDDGCGNPMFESQIYGYRKGKVIKITNSNNLIVEVTNSNNVWNDEHEEETDDESKLIKPQMFEVSLVGIDSAINKKAIADFLKENLLNKQVTIVGNTKKKKGNKIQALVRFIKDEFEEVSEYLLENGIARFKGFQLTNLVPIRTHCELERAETNAKKEKLGIWAK